MNPEPATVTVSRSASPVLGVTETVAVAVAATVVLVVVAALVVVVGAAQAGADKLNDTTMSAAHPGTSLIDRVPMDAPFGMPRGGPNHHARSAFQYPVPRSSVQEP